MLWVIEVLDDSASQFGLIWSEWTLYRSQLFNAPKRSSKHHPFFHSHRENNTSLVMIFIPIHEIVYRRTKNIPKQEYCIQMYQVAILKSPLKSRSDFLLGKMMGFSISAISFGELLDPPTSESLKSSSSFYYRLAVVLKVPFMFTSTWGNHPIWLAHIFDMGWLKTPN